ncbi:MAG: M48 family metalloprotease [Vicinamibacterales bacterium]
MTIEELADRIMQSESGVTARMRAFRPIVEIYVQHVEAHETLGSVPLRDDYFLGQFEWTDEEGPRLRTLTPEKGTGQQLAERLAHPLSLQLRPGGFAAMVVPDWRLLNSKGYAFKFLRREVLGEVRCLVLDVQPSVDSQDGFTGRIWVEDQDFNIVRFNGISRFRPRSTLMSKPYWFSVDSWRVNVLPAFWLPAYVYAEQESDEGAKIKSQVRLWGYDLTTIHAPAESPTNQIVRFATVEEHAEASVLDRLSKAGLLAPPGEVEKILETVAMNLQITNHLTIEPPVRTRVLLTSPIESFTVGHTIVMSRGLIDVLPDEASLATMLAHELAHITLGHRATDPKAAVADKLTVPDDELLAKVRAGHEPREEEAADAKAIDLLKNSPYKDKLTDTGLFPRVVSGNSRKLKNLIQPHIGARMDQIATLPLGSRIVVDPWTGKVELLRTPAVPLTSAREKASLSVTPLVPYLRYAVAKP